MKQPDRPRNPHRHCHRNLEVRLWTSLQARVQTLLASVAQLLRSQAVGADEQSGSAARRRKLHAWLR